MYIYNGLNDTLSAFRIHNNLQTVFSKYIQLFTETRLFKDFEGLEILLL